MELFPQRCILFRNELCAALWQVQQQQSGRLPRALAPAATSFTRVRVCVCVLACCGCLFGQLSFRRERHISGAHSLHACLPASHTEGQGSVGQHQEHTATTPGRNGPVGCQISYVSSVRACMKQAGVVIPCRCQMGRHESAPIRYPYPSETAGSGLQNVWGSATGRPPPPPPLLLLLRVRTRAQEWICTLMPARA